MEISAQSTISWSSPNANATETWKQKISFLASNVVKVNKGMLNQIENCGHLNVV